MLTRRTRASLGILSSVAMVSTALALPAGASSDVSVPSDVADAIEANKGTQTYVVVLDDEPVATYDGDLAGYAATRGRSVDSGRARRYAGFLEGKQDKALRRAGVDSSRKDTQFTTALNGFTVDLTASEAAKLRHDLTVLSVAPNEIHELTTNSTPEFLGLTGTADGNGLWEQGIVGEDVVIGVIDSGVRPENPSFADDGSYGPLSDWAGTCDTGLDGSMTCDPDNDKLIGARVYGEGFFGEGYTVEDVKAEFPLEFASPLDADGHGTHTASTAGGNGGVETQYGEISGIAPRARVAVYKTCWGYSGQGGCATADSVAAIDQAVADGVDVINYSISGTADNYRDPVEIAFLFAADAGVVVNASAGNSGPTLSTANHPSPWINTVAAGTEDAAFAGELILGDGSEFSGRPSIGSEGIDQTPLVFAGDIPAADVSVEDAALCLDGSLDPAGAEGNMVLCNRGEIARVAKSDEVARAGGVAMILANVDDNSSLNSDAHVVPTIHVDNTVRQAVAVYLESTESPTAALTPARVTTIVAPDPAGFSSRGPIGHPDVLKPDILAPGVDILAAYSPTVGGRDFDFLSGTSMSSPHAAGHAALLKQAHPTWSSSAVQSAMMTTAYQTRTDGSEISGTPLAWGSGHIDPNPSVDPGLVYEAGFTDWIGFICGTGQLPPEVFCEGGALGAPIDTIEPGNLNEPNITIGELAGNRTVTRTVTNVGKGKARYDATVDAPPGIDVEVSPSSIVVPPGKSVSFDVTFTTTDDATTGEFAFGSLTWTDRSGKREVRSTLTAKPVQLAAPDEVFGSGTDGSNTYEIGFGYNGEFAAAAHGMEAANTVTNTVVDDPTNDINTALETGVGVNFEVIEIPEGTAFTRVALFDDYTDGQDDLDLYVFGPQSAEFPFVGQSGAGTSEEAVDLLFPAPGIYLVAVHGWETDGPDAQYTLFDWSVSADPANDDGSLTVDAPTEAVLGETADVTATWSDLEAGTKHLGAVSYSDADGVFGLTLVNVSTD